MNANEKSETTVTGGPEVRVTDESTRSLVGLLAFSALAAMTRLAKDGDQAPSPEFHIEHARMSADAFGEFRHLEDFAAKNGIDLLAEVAQFAGLFDELDARTRPSNWWERSVKTYVTLGIFADALSDINQRQQLFDEEAWVGDLGQGAWVRDHLAERTETDEQLAARLSLWARRVAGEAFGLLRATLFTYPELTLDPDTVDAVVAAATKRHNERLEAVNLQP